jgi:tetratricopeptide (TPR) repeat protein
MAKKEIKKSKKAGQKTAVALSVHAEQALQEYDRALQLLRKQDFTGAADGFKAILKNHPQEKEIGDRCRVYLRVCERDLGEKVLPLKRVEDYYYQAVLESNRQRYDEALKHLDRAIKMNPKDDRLLYVLASTQALKGDREQALAALKESIDLNATNRIHAQHDPDFDPLRDDDAFLDLVLPRKD